jgi:hypothetical protein
MTAPWESGGMGATGLPQEQAQGTTRRRMTGPFAMVPQAVIESGLDNACFRLYSYCLCAEGPGGSWVMAGANEIAGKISMQAATLLTHARHLKTAGLMDFKRHGQKEYVFKILHNPVQGRCNPMAQIPPSEPRARKVSKFAQPAQREPKVSEERFSPVGTNAKHGSEAAPRPARNEGRSKSAKKYEERYVEEAVGTSVAEKCTFPGCDESILGHTMRDHEPVHASTVGDLLIVSDLADSDLLHVDPGVSDFGYVPADLDWFITDLAEDDPRLDGAPDSRGPAFTDDDIARWEAEDAEECAA